MNTMCKITLTSLMFLTLVACGGAGSDPPALEGGASNAVADTASLGAVELPNASTSNKVFEPGGLGAVFFPALNFGGTPVRSQPSKIDYNWANQAPEGLSVKDNFSVRWSGQVMSKYNEVYTFVTRSDDGVRLFVGNKLLIDDWTDHAVLERKTRVQLQAGVKYDITLEYYERTGQASVKLLWKSASQPLEVIPSTSLYSEVTQPLSSQIPKNLRTLSLTPRTLTLKWDTVSQAFSYLVERRSGNGEYVSKGSVEASSVFANDSLNDSDLIPNTVYGYRVRALTPQGASEWATLEVKTPPEAPVLANPTDFKARKVTTTSIDFEWVNVSGAFAYSIDRKNSAGSYEPLSTFESFLGSGDRNLTPDTSYTYRLKATAGGNNASSGVELTVRTLPI